MNRTFRIAYAATAAAATIAGSVGDRRSAAITKPLPIALLAARVAAGARRRPVADTVALASVVGFSALGDRFMLQEEFEHAPAAKDRFLRRGATSFAGAQLSYAVAMWRAGARPTVRSVTPRVGVLAESATVLSRHRPALLPVLGTYGNTLATMSALAAAVPTPQPRMQAGGWFFLLSDLAIINRRHLVTDPRLRVAGEAWVLASYFTAQYLLIGGLADR